MKIEIYKNSKGEWMSRIKTRNGRIRFDSAESYKRKPDCLKALQWLVYEAGDAQFPSAVELDANGEVITEHVL